MTQPSYARPASVEEAVSTLASARSARPLAGGTDLMVQMRLGNRRPDLVVDTSGLEELHRLDTGDPASLGAAVTLRRFLHHRELTNSFPALAQAANLLGGRQVQAMATFGGNVCNASPAAETTTPLLVHDARVIVAGPSGRREFPLADFFIGPGRTVLEQDELLIALLLRAPRGDQRSAYRRIELRRSVDIAVVSTAAWVEVEDGRIVAARVAIGAASPIACCVPAACEALVGAEVDDTAAISTAIAEAAASCREESRPIGDTRASAAYRSAMVEVTASRALRAVIEQAP